MNGKKAEAATFVAGGLAYNGLEILWRGFTHISMFFLGGICFCAMIRIALRDMGILRKCLISGTFITMAEFLSGCVLNLVLGLNVWDYSAEPLNLLGQVCASFFLLWCLLSAAIIPLIIVVRR